MKVCFLHLTIVYDSNPHFLGTMHPITLDNLPHVVLELPNLLLQHQMNAPIMLEHSLDGLKMRNVR